MRAAARSHHGAEQLLRDHRGEQGWRRGRHRHLRADRGQPPARPDHARPASGSGTVITGNPTKAGTFNFTVKATDGGLTATMAYQITVTVQGPPDQLLCNAANGSFLISGVCVLPDAVVGQPYQGHLPTSHNAGGTLSIVAGALPPGLALPATFGTSGDVVGGTPTTAPAPTASPCKAPATRASPCIRPTRSRWTRTCR